MRRLAFPALMLLAGCGGGDPDPVRVAERYHELRRTADDRGLHALLTEADREALPLERFPAELPPALARDLLGWGEAAADSAALLSQAGDTAEVVLYVEGGGRDTLRLIATRESRKLLLWETEDTRWRVSLALTERARIDSLAGAMRAAGDRPDEAAAGAAQAYLEAAGAHPDLARLPDVEAARYRLRSSRVAEALEVDLHRTTSITGAPYVEGRVSNPTDERVATVELVVRDAAGAEETVELWTIEPGAQAPVRRLTRLGSGPLTHRVGRIQVF
jgi:hypothetical protein